MKNINYLLILSLFLTFPRQTLAQSVQEAVGQIRQRHLSARDVGALRQNPSEIGQSLSANNLRGDLTAFERLRIAPPLSPEGLPSRNDRPDPRDVVESAYTTSTLIERAIATAQTRGIGERIQVYENFAGRILRRSGQRTADILVRLTLNRSVDVIRTVIGTAGANPEFVALWVANFYHETFRLAAMLANNPGVATHQGNVNVANFLQRVSLAEFSRIYSRLLFSASTSLTSDSSKAILLMKLIGFVGFDCNNDLRRRSLAEVIADIYTLQNDEPAYQNVVQSLLRGQEPSSRDLASLRSQVYEILSTLPERLSRAGVQTLQVPMAPPVPQTFMPLGLPR
jgi:hypothetical protein